MQSPVINPSTACASQAYREYRICAKTVMDTSDPNITFDDKGICNHYYSYYEEERKHLLQGDEGRSRLDSTAKDIRQCGKNNKYDCILGLSGGVDSTYLCLVAKELGLRPLVVHFDNGWNSELAIQNIENTVKRLDFDLFTHVVEWDEFRELQRSYFLANVIDIEVLTDHAFMAVLYQQALKYKIRYVLAGMNVVTETILPRDWIYNKGDLGNIKGIQQAHGSRRVSDFRSYPFLSPVRKVFIDRILRMNVVSPLNWLDYNYLEVKDKIKRELGWRDYGGKHYESVFTRFYQGSILPAKFGVDKRRAHLSTLICSGQITRDDALSQLTLPSLCKRQEQIDRHFVLKKLGFTEEEFSQYLCAPRRQHEVYGTSTNPFVAFPMLSLISPILRLLFPAR
jgi:N-acetyl sugar amidotransferase